MGMKKENDYIDRTILKLRRQYGKEELVAALIKQLREKDVEIGKLNSEIDHLNAELQSDKEEKEINKTARVQVRKDELYKLQKEKNREQLIEIRKLRKMRDDLIAENVYLKG